MTKVEATQAQQNFPELMSRVRTGKERIVIEQQGQGMVAMISYEDFKRLQALEEDAKDVAEVERRLAANEESVSLETVIEGYNRLHDTDLTIEHIVKA
ncbi:type II toxin-antitoxin system Phd/YefM family antitoxin [Phormidesmis sp. 146-33]